MARGQRWKSAVAAMPLGLLVAGVTGPASAHPHLWIDVSATMLFDENKQVAGIATRWLFDEMYSTFATDGMDTDGDGKLSTQELAPLAAENIKQLQPWHYFLVVENGGKRLTFAPVNEYHMTMGAGRLTMDMTLRLTKPVDPHGKPLRFAFFDPSYYIDLVFSREKPLGLEGPPNGCRARIDEPNTQGGTTIADEIATAMKPDPDKPLESLGARFAEWVSLICGKD